jgi:hypothetical protein
VPWSAHLEDAARPVPFHFDKAVDIGGACLIAGDIDDSGRDRHSNIINYLKRVRRGLTEQRPTRPSGPYDGECHKQSKLCTA